MNVGLSARVDSMTPVAASVCVFGFALRELNSRQSVTIQGRFWPLRHRLVKTLQVMGMKIALKATIKRDFQVTSQVPRQTDSFLHAAIQPDLHQIAVRMTTKKLNPDTGT